MARACLQVFIFSDLMKAKKAKKAKKLSNQICNKTTYQE
jgi:hypothetical protein